MPVSSPRMTLRGSTVEPEQNFEVWWFQCKSWHKYVYTYFVINKSDELDDFKVNTQEASDLAEKLCS